MPYLNKGYTKHADWAFTTPRDWTFGGFFNARLNHIVVRIDIPPTLDSMTATITDWDFNRLPPSVTGDGFVDVIGFAWWDERDHTAFYDTWFPNTTRYHYPDGTPYEPVYIPEAERSNITVTQGSGFYDLDTWFYVWQGNEGRDRWGLEQNPIGKSHTWPLTEADFDEHGALKDRIVFVSYNRHLDWGDNMNPGCIPGDDPRHAHWQIDYRYWFSDGIWNWKYHPWAIRKDGTWYSCNRLDAEVGHGDGHMAIRKGGRWNAVWNDDFDISDNEAHDDEENGSVGPFIPSPRVGIGCDAVRQKDDVHEWEE